MRIEIDEAAHAVNAYDASGATAGRLSFAVFDDGAVIRAVGAMTNPEYRGQGVATRMLDALTAFARQRHAKISPECDFIRAKFDMEPETYRDVDAR